MSCIVVNKDTTQRVKLKISVIGVENINDADIMQILCIKLFAKNFPDNARFNNLRNELKSAFH